MIPPRTPDDIALIIHERIQESTTLDFKRELPPAGKNANIAKAICALSNTAGGHLIVGVEEDDDSRAALACPSSLAGCTERITLIARTLDEPVTPVSVYTIEEQPGHGYAVAEFALSERAPHFYEGTAYGRTPKTTAALSRRQVGDLFARSTGFVDEFRLRTQKPGRVLVRAGRAEKHTWLSFTNDGESDVSEVTWLQPELSGFIVTIVYGWPFPIPVLRPGQEVRQTVAVALGRGPFNVLTSWRDSNGELQTQDWRIAL